jgi:hypothetical protein
MNSTTLGYCSSGTVPEARVCESEKNSASDYHVSGDGLSRNWVILLGHRRLQYVGEETLGVADGKEGTLGAGAPVALGDKKPGLWAGPTSRRRRPSGL